MRLNYLLFIVSSLLLIVSSCQEADIETFQGRNQLYFNKFWTNAQYPGTELADSTVVSFFNYSDNTKQIEAKLVVNLSGILPNRSLNYRIKVVEEETTANLDEYSIMSEYTFHTPVVIETTTDVRDTLTITLNRSERLAQLGEKGLRLVVELIPGEDYQLGQYERTRAIIIWTAVEAMPSWWDVKTEIGHQVTWSLLGEFSYEKYKLFKLHGDPNAEMCEELIKQKPSRAIELVTNFKKWLIENLDDKEHGDTYREILNSLKI